MKKLIICFLLVAVAFAASSQRVNLDRYYAKFTCRSLPTKPLPPNERSYSVHVNFNKNVSSIVDPEMVADQIKITGLEKKSTGGSVIIDYRCGQVEIHSIDVAENKEETKDKEGNVRVRYTYNGVMKYSFDSHLGATKPDGTTLVTLSFSNASGINSEKIYKSDSFDKYRDASEYMKNNKEVIVEKIIREHVKRVPWEANAYLDKVMGYRASTENYLFWYLGTKDHPEYEAHMKNYQAVKEIVEKVTENGGLAEARDKAQPLIAYLEDVIKRYPDSDKKSRKMRYASYYNLARLYNLLGLPEAAVKNGDLLYANDYDKGDGKRLAEDAKKLEEILKLNNVESRHFPLSVEN